MSAGSARRRLDAPDPTGGSRERPPAADSGPHAGLRPAPAVGLDATPPAAGDAIRPRLRGQAGPAIRDLPAHEAEALPALRPGLVRPSPPSDPPPPNRWRAGASTAAAGKASGLAGVTFSTADLVGLRKRAAGLSPDAHRSSRGGRAGVRASRLRGRGMEYSESRTYMPGDDLRSIDWRVTARTGRVHTKLFHEERDRPVLFVVDLGEHMRFGTRRAFKSVVAAEAASLLAWAAVANGDRVGGLVFAGGHTAESRIEGGRRGALALFRTLAGVQDEAGGRNTTGGIETAMPLARRAARPGTLVIVISDFSGLRDPVIQQLAKLREHNDLLCAWVYDELESTPPPPARYPIGDGRRTAILDTGSSEVARAVSRRFDAIETRISSLCGRTGAMLVRIRCGDDVPAVLRETLIGRVRRAAPRPVRTDGATLDVPVHPFR